MWLGIDVGGTFTDAVVVREGRVTAEARCPTSPDLLGGILGALDGALEQVAPADVVRVALSTTVVTNALVQGTLDPVALLVLPGPGMSVDGLVPGRPVILRGSIDHRGREVCPPDGRQIDAALAALGAGEALAVSGKFSVRNPRHERLVAQRAGARHVSMGAEMSGGLNFIRRTGSAWYNAAVWRCFGEFARAIETALRERSVGAPVYVLKADGGTLPLEEARRLPVEAIFTGPAASVLGVLATAAPAEEAVSVDIGGTTTDIALWRGGVPIFAERGARVGGHVTAVRSFWLQSVGVGGDSEVRREGDGFVVGPLRQGPAMALGGPAPTVSDAMIVLGKADFGDRARASSAMQTLAGPGESADEVARRALDAAVEQVAGAIEAMIEQRASEPVYRVEDVVHADRLHPQLLVGVGGAAAGFAPRLAERLRLRCRVAPHAAVANAVGAAVARPTVDLTLRADTVQGVYTVPELGLQEALQGREGPADARRLAHGHLRERAERAGIEVGEVETVLEESFNVVRGFSTAGRIMTCRVQIRPGVLSEVAP